MYDHEELIQILYTGFSRIKDIRSFQLVLSQYIILVVFVCTNVSDKKSKNEILLLLTNLLTEKKRELSRKKKENDFVWSHYFVSCLIIICESEKTKNLCKYMSFTIPEMQKIICCFCDWESINTYYTYTDLLTAYVKYVTHSDTISTYVYRLENMYKQENNFLYTHYIKKHYI